MPQGSFSSNVNLCSGNTEIKAYIESGEKVTVLIMKLCVVIVYGLTEIGSHGAAVIRRNSTE